MRVPPRGSLVAIGPGAYRAAGTAGARAHPLTRGAPPPARRRDVRSGPRDVCRRSGPLSGSRRRPDWATLGASVGSTSLLALLLSLPLLLGAHVGYWLVAGAVGAALGAWLHLRREPGEEPGPDADEVRF